MKPSQLQLQHSHFTGVSLIAEDAPDESSSSPYPKIDAEKIKVEITLGELSNEPNRGEYLITLGVSDGESIPGFPYRFVARIEGFFELMSDDPNEERKRLTVINGASMLYGIIREQLLSLSSRHRNGPLLLPSLDFRGLKERSKGPQEEQKTAKLEKPKRNRKKAVAVNPAG